MALHLARVADAWRDAGTLLPVADVVGVPHVDGGQVVVHQVPSQHPWAEEVVARRMVSLEQVAGWQAGSRGANGDPGAEVAIDHIAQNLIGSGGGVEQYDPRPLVIRIAVAGQGVSKDEPAARA